MYLYMSGSLCLSLIVLCYLSVCACLNSCVCVSECVSSNIVCVGGFFPVSVCVLACVFVYDPVSV